MKIHEIIKEAVELGKKHLTHPEDLAAYYGTEGANFALNAIVNTVKSPAKITIKYDGYPALVWGYDQNGRFILVDKHMFDKKDGTGRQIFSPQDFINYDNARGAERPTLHAGIVTAWDSIKQSTPKTPGFYWGDTLFTQPLNPIKIGDKNVFQFKANPWGLLYKIDADSDVGKLITNKPVGIAVHQFIPANQTAEEAISLEGTLGKLRPTGNVAIIPAKMPVTPILTLDKRMITFVEGVINQNAASTDQLFSSMPINPKTWIGTLISPFINQQMIATRNLNDVVKRSYEFVLAKAPSNKMRNELEPWLQNNQQGLASMWLMWGALFNLKNVLIPQLEEAAKSSPVKGYLDTGVESQEGYVSQGVKFVDRLGFGSQIHSKR